MPKIISKQELKKLYSSHTAREASKKLGISPPTFYKLLREAGIQLRGHNPSIGEKRGGSKPKIIIK